MSAVIRFFPLLLSLFIGCSDLKTPSRSGANSENRNPISKTTDQIDLQRLNTQTNVVTEQAADGFARQLQAAFGTADLEQIDRLVSNVRIAKYALRNSGLPREAEQIYLEAASRASLLGSTLQLVKESGDYQFLHFRPQGTGFEPLFRVTLEDGGFIYQWFHLCLNESKEVVADDIL